MTETQDPYPHISGTNSSSPHEGPRLIRWDLHEEFLGHLASFSNGELEAFDRAEQNTKNIFLLLLFRGITPYSAALIFSSGYCAAADSFLIGPCPDDMEGE